MKILLIFILFSVTSTGVLSDVAIPAGQFVRNYLYIPYRGVPGALNPTRPHAKQIFVLALVPPGRVSLGVGTILKFHGVGALTPMPWGSFSRIPAVSNPLYHAATGLMSIYISIVDYSQYEAQSGIPVEAHPDFTIYNNIQKILKQFKTEFHGRDPAMVLMYSYYSPCNDCTDGLIRMKKALPDPRITPIILGYSNIYKNAKTHQTPDENIAKLFEKKFVVIRTGPATLASLEYLQRMLQ